MFVAIVSGLSVAFVVFALLYGTATAWRWLREIDAADGPAVGDASVWSSPPG